ncbi:site-specific integrase [Pseudoalteromonas maricaloris]|uniref:Site-specific integrase n=1 Tax=Pseudoalteromonas maricaloris TaxID=184924 RepID=A0A8I2KP67_9GAMM|nr:site-specific integrase [Pseudoalteromonas maricaloris]NLR20678.1 site-specific integrase [Pseudoalteromonas maricaloris]WOX29838.1 site-specific integrase [Pseudoalteromonas maricaloris]
MVTEQIKRLKAYVAEIKTNPDKAWEIPVGNKAKKDDYYAMASHALLSKELDISTQALGGKTSAAKSYVPLMKELNDIMINEGVLIERTIASALELRRITMLWWKGLSEEEKLNLDHFGNSIKFKKYIKGWRGGKNYEKVIELGEQLNKELIDKGVLRDDYLSVKDRDKLLDKEFIPKQEATAQRWRELEALSLESIEDLLDPNSSEEPFVQLKQLVANVMASYSAKSSKSNFRDGYKHMCAFLEKSNVDTSSHLKDILSEYLLVRFKQDYVTPKLEDESLSPLTVPTLISSIRTILKRARALKGLDFHGYIDVEIEAKGRTTDSYKPYGKQERDDIDSAIKKDIDVTNALRKPYEKVAVGTYPLDNKGHLKQGFGTIENARYLFEEHLNCTPVYFNSAKTIEEKGFLKIVGKLELGLHEIYKSWGVLSIVDADVIAPFAFRLAQITGMNADPIFDLCINDFVKSHETIAKPCLRYWKERSTGEKELLLDLFEAKLQWLSKKQSIEVQSIFEVVIGLTAEIRKEADDSIKDKLFIFKSTGQTTYGEIKSFSNSKNNTGIYRNFVNRHSLRNEDGEPLLFSISRFRPTFVSEMLEAGVSIREIQLMLGHSNIQTTMNYLDRLDFNRFAREKLSEALSKIHQRTIVPKNDKSVPSEERNNPDRIIFTTPLSGCANIFSPPDFIRNMPSYVEGQACSQYNKCLSCENVLLAANHLPMLFAMRRDYLILTQRNRIMETPYGYVIEENLALLDEVLNPKKSDFSIEDLERAERLAVYEETAIVDGVTA